MALKKNSTFDDEAMRPGFPYFFFFFLFLPLFLFLSFSFYFYFQNKKII